MCYSMCVCVGVQRLAWHECGHLHLSPRCARVTAMRGDTKARSQRPCVSTDPRAIIRPKSIVIWRMRPLIAMRISLTPRLQRGRRGRHCGVDYPLSGGMGRGVRVGCTASSRLADGVGCSPVQNAPSRRISWRGFDLDLDIDRAAMACWRSSRRAAAVEAGRSRR